MPGIAKFVFGLRAMTRSHQRGLAAGMAGSLKIRKPIANKQRMAWRDF